MVDLEFSVGLNTKFSTNTKYVWVLKMDRILNTEYNQVLKMDRI